MNRIGMINKLFKRHQMADEQAFYVHGSGLIRIPIGRLNEIPRVIREFHEYHAAMMKLAISARH